MVLMNDVLSVRGIIEVGKDERVNIEPTVNWEGNGCD
jgi:hypothetical protein